MKQIGKFIYNEILVYLFRELMGEPKLMLATSLEQSTYKTWLYKYALGWIKRLRGWTKRQIHIFTERLKMTRELWLIVARMYNWTCLNCGIQNLYNKEIGKPKMEVDHIKPLYLFGLTILVNLQLLCSICNKRKSVREIDLRMNWVSGRWVRRKIIF